MKGLSPFWEDGRLAAVAAGAARHWDENIFWLQQMNENASICPSGVRSAATSFPRGRMAAISLHLPPCLTAVRRQQPSDATLIPCPSCLFFPGRSLSSGSLGPDGVDRRPPPALRLLRHGLRGLPRLQLRPGRQRGPPHKVLHPRPVLSGLRHHGHGQADHAARRGAVRHHRRLPKGRHLF